MKPNFLKKLSITLLAVAQATFLATSTRAQNATVSYNDGDLMMGFRVLSGTGSASDLLTDLGNVSNFVGLAPGTIINLNNGTVNMGSTNVNAIGNLGADMSSTFGSDWYTRLDTSGTGGPALKWGTAGTVQFAGDGASGDPVNTLYAGKAALSPTWTRESSGSQGVPSNNIAGMGSNGYDSNTSTSNSNFNLVQSTGSHTSWASFMPGGANATGGNAFAYFNGSQFEQTGGSQLLYLDRIQPGTGQSVPLGFFSLDSSGDLTFTVTAVPEPATWLMPVLGVVALLITQRRRIPALR